MGAGHQQTDPFAVDSARGIEIRQLAARDHRDAIGDLEDLVEILADYQDRGAGARHVGEHLADQGRGTGVHAPGRLVDHQYMRVAVQLPSHHELLQVTPGERRGRRVLLAGANVEPLADSRRRAARPGAVDESGAHHAAVGGMARQQHVVGQNEARYGAVAEPFLGHEGSADPPACGHATRAAMPSGDRDCCSRRSRPLAGQSLEQLGLAVAGHPGDRHHFTRTHLQGDVAQRYPERSAGRQRQVGNSQQWRAVP